MKAPKHGPIQRDVSLREFNSFGVDASAALFARIRSLDELQRALADPSVAGAPLLLLGGGSNLLFTQDFDGCALKIEIPGVKYDSDGDHFLVEAGAGENWHVLVERSIDESMPGLENLALIPGCVGAAPIQNIGAYGVELAERFRCLQVWDFATQSVLTLTADQCGFGYRDSVFKHQPQLQLIISVTFALPRRWVPVVRYVDIENELRARNIAQPQPRDVFAAVVAIRQRKLPDPMRIGNAGSFFKNPVVSRQQHAALIERHPSLVSYDIGGGRYKLAAGWLIDACGLRGVVRGRAAVYQRQALVLVNLGGATGAEILALAREVQDAVQARFNVELEPEPRIL